MTELANLALALGICAASLGVGMIVVAVLDRGRIYDGATRLGAALLVGFLIVHFAVWGVGSLRYDASTMGLLLAVLGVVSLFGLRRIDRRELGRWYVNCLLWAGTDSRAATGFVVLAALALTAILAGLAPPSDFDGLNYHLALAKFDLERGFIRPWDLNFLGYFPALGEMLDRLALALAGPEAAQVLNGLTAVATAGLLAAITHSGGASRATSLSAAIMFLALRGVAWESGTSYVEVMLAAFTLAAFAVLESWRRAPGLGLAVLFGLLIGGAINVKYHGFAVAIAFAPSLLWGLRRSIELRQIVVAAAVACAAILPFTLRNLLLVGDPVFPLFQMTEYIGTIGTGEDFLSLLRAPWDISIYAARHFDGHVLGTPFLLALLPSVFWAREGRALALRALVPTGIYFALWFFLLSQQVRFLLPVAPFLCLAAAVGSAEVWRTVRAQPIVRACFVCLIGLMVLGQSAYLGAMALMRIPVAVGLMDETTYLTRVPTIQGSHFVPCRYLSERLKPGETYMMFVTPRSYYCPQSSIAAVDTGADPHTIATELKAKRVRFVMIQTSNELRNDPEGATLRQHVDVSARVGPVLQSALGRIDPVFRDDFAAIYDTKDVLRALD